MALIKEFFEISEKYAREYGDNTILLMQVGSFFEVYGLKDKIGNITGSKIIEFSQICELNVVDKNSTLENKIVVMAGFKDFMIDKYLRKIQDAGYTAVVYKQDEAAKNTTRSLEGIYSPGTFFANENTQLTNNTTCVWIDLIDNKFTKGKVVVIGISNIDIYTGNTNIFEYKEKYLNAPTTFDELERFISIYNPSEFIIISNLPQDNINDIINYVNVKCKVIHKISLDTPNTNTNTEKYVRVHNCMKQIYQKEILNKFYKINDNDIFFQNFYDNIIATQSFCYLLDFMYQHNPHLVYKISEPKFDNFTERLILANHSLKQLNIIDDNNYNGKCSSVLKLLNNCLTPMGKRKFSYHFLNPTTNEEFLNNEYDIIEYILNKFDIYFNVLSSKLKEIKDISKWERQVFIKKISPNSFYNLYNNINTIIELYDAVIDDTIIVQYLTFKDINILNIKKDCIDINNFIHHYLNLELAKEIEQLQSFEHNFINNGIDDILDEKTSIIQDSVFQLETIKNYLSDLIKNKEKNIKTNDYVKIHETEKNNYSLVTTNKRAKILEELLPPQETPIQLKYNDKSIQFFIKKGGFNYLKQTASNTFICDNQIDKLCNNISITKSCIRDLILRVYNNFIYIFGEKYQEKIEQIINFVTYLDIILSKANTSKKYNFCKPNIQPADKSFVKATNIRHILIENLQTNEFYVTNNIILGDNDTDFILLYGTNAVGKTSLIKSLGISVMMAQAGLYVPCSEFIFKPYKYIFTRILGNDNIFKGLSTFAVEMSELRTILRLADKNSLVLGDELCSGTEITSAISICVSAICNLHTKKASCIFATHLHEIVNYDEITGIDSLKIKHMSVVYDKEKDLLIYDRKLKDGPGSGVYGLEVAKSLNLPDDFIELAYEIRMKYNKQSEGVLSKKISHFNSKKLIGICENCNLNVSSEVHHLIHQSSADNDGYLHLDGIKAHKNKLPNLLSLCKKCHDDFHKETKTQHIKVKTNKGYIVKEL